MRTDREKKTEREREREEGRNEVVPLKSGPKARILMRL